MKTEFEHINWELLSRCLSDEATVNDKKELDLWLSADDKHKKLYNFFLHLENKREIFKKVNDLHVEKALHQIRTKKINIRTFNLKLLLRVAAIFIIAFGISLVARFLITSSTYIVINTGSNERIETILSDGTVVTVNENTKFKYPKKFDDDKRKVELNGEAFFNVTPDKLNPFIINMKELFVKVLGTEFNVESYVDANEIIVTVQEGTVEFGIQNQSSQRPVILANGNEGRFIKETSAIYFNETSSANQIAWKTKYLVFKDETLDNVVQKLEEVYFVKFVIDEKLKMRRLNAVYDNQPIEFIIQILESTLNIKVNELDKNKYEIVMR